MSRPKISKKMIHQITQKRIITLFALAEKQMKKGNVNLSNRYIHHARKLSMKNCSSIPSELKHRYCKHCYAYLHPDRTCQIRTRHGSVIKRCFNCHKITRIPFK